mgnify:FL=1
MFELRYLIVRSMEAIEARVTMVTTTSTDEGMKTMIMVVTRVGGKVMVVRKILLYSLSRFIKTILVRSRW